MERTVKDLKFYIRKSIFYTQKGSLSTSVRLNCRFFLLTLKVFLKIILSNKNATIHIQKIGIEISKTINSYLN